MTSTAANPPFAVNVVMYGTHSQYFIRPRPYLFNLVSSQCHTSHRLSVQSLPAVWRYSSSTEAGAPPPTSEQEQYGPWAHTDLKNRTAAINM